MKAQVNTFEAAKESTNKVMFISFIVIGIILFIVSGKNFWNDVYSKTVSSYEVLNPNNGFANIGLIIVKKANNSRNEAISEYLTPLKPCCSKNIVQELEVEKMENFMSSNEMTAFQQALAAFNDVEEPELLVEDVFGAVETQTTQFEEVLENQAAFKTNAYLEELYAQKTSENLADAEIEWILEQYGVAETEDELEVEDWMTSNDKWNANTTVLSYFAEEETENKLEVEEWMTSSENWNENTTVLSYFAEAETENELEIEEWMTSNKNWNVESTLPAHLTERATEKPLNLEEWMVSENIWK